MKKKFIRRVKRHIKRKKAVYLRISLVVVLLVIAIWSAEQMNLKEDEHAEVVKALTGTADERFQVGKEKAVEGEMAEARTIMLRLARLGDSADKPVGYGPAHLWVAQEILKHVKTDFMQVFPFSSGGVGAGGTESTTDSTTEKASSPVWRLDRDEVLRAQRHLEHAVALNPELKEASVLLAATYAVQKNRNQAVDILLNAVTHAKHPNPALHVPLANVLTMSGDDALFLKKDDNADITIRRLEMEKLGGWEVEKSRGEEVTKEDQVRALRMAYYYHRAIRNYQLSNSDIKRGYAAVVDDLERVLEIQPDCAAAVGGLSLIASRDAGLRPRLQKILQKVLLQERKEKHQDSLSHLTSDISLSLAMMEDESNLTAKKKYLEQAVQANPNNEEALVRLAQILVAAPQLKVSDYDRIKELAQRGLQQESLKKDPVLLAECYAVLGQVYVKTKQWSKAIVALERSLAGLKNTKSVKILLIEAYTATGQTEMVEALRENLE